ncbi:MAG: nitrile hydratase subunit beta [Chloroflexi bacterium]|nr:nitrile hydratase subunit beta [Chloroflexota bacterium]
MNGVHDMGGMHGFGPVLREENEPVFHESWEGRVFGLVVSTRVPGGGRPAIEAMPPAEYLSSSYYEKWLHAKTVALIAAGYVTQGELDDRLQEYRDNPGLKPKRVENLALVAEQRERMAGIFPPARDPEGEAEYLPGDAVRARNINPVGHTRLPRYIRGHLGTVDRIYGWHEIQDQDPPGVTIEGIEPVYSVRFEGGELWGEQAEPNSCVYIDMWESYLEPA